MFKFGAFLVSLVLISLFIPTALAGGGLVSYDVVPPTGKDNFNILPGEQFVVRPYVHLNDGSFCNNCPIKVKLENPQPGDYIAQSSETTDAQGTMYAKVISYIPGVRYAYAEVTLPDGEVYTGSKTSLNYAPTYIYGQEEPTPSTVPSISPSPIIYPSIKPSLKPSIKPVIKPSVIPSLKPVPTPSIPPATQSATPPTNVTFLPIEPKETNFVEQITIQLVIFLNSIFKG